MIISSKITKNASAEPKQVFRQFAWNLASNLAQGKISTPKGRRSAQKKKTTAKKASSK